MVVSCRIAATHTARGGNNEHARLRGPEWMKEKSRRLIMRAMRQTQAILVVAWAFMAVDVAFLVLTLIAQRA
jgi:hypothetical protein